MEDIPGGASLLAARDRAVAAVVHAYGRGMLDDDSCAELLTEVQTATDVQALDGIARELARGAAAPRALDLADLGRALSAFGSGGAPDVVAGRPVPGPPSPGAEAGAPPGATEVGVPPGATEAGVPPDDGTTRAVPGPAGGAPEPLVPGAPSDPLSHPVGGTAAGERSAVPPGSAVLPGAAGPPGSAVLPGTAVRPGTASGRAGLAAGPRLAAGPDVNVTGLPIAPRPGPVVAGRPLDAVDLALAARAAQQRRARRTDPRLVSLAIVVAMLVVLLVLGVVLIGAVHPAPGAGSGSAGSPAVGAPLAVPGA